jgi:glutaredoxin
MEKIIIYTNETCPYCKRIKEELTKASIEFEEKLVSDFKDEWQDIVNLTGMSILPTICYKDNYFVPSRDFNNPSHLISIIKEFKPCKFPIETQVLEKIKTLNYGINTAFGRVDQLLRKIETKLNTEEKDEHKSTS